MHHLNIHVPSGWASTRTGYRVGVVGWVRDQVFRAACWQRSRIVFLLGDVGQRY